MLIPPAKKKTNRYKICVEYKGLSSFCFIKDVLNVFYKTGVTQLLWVPHHIYKILSEILKVITSLVILP